MVMVMLFFYSIKDFKNLVDANVIDISEALGKETLRGFEFKDED